MMITLEKVTQKSITRARRSVHHSSFLWASFGGQELVRSTTQRFVACSGAGLPFLRRSPEPGNEPSGAREWPPNRSRDRDAPSPALGQPSEFPQSFQRLSQERRVVTVCRRHDGAQRDALKGCPKGMP
jgi:hypothetical protein